MVQRHLKFNRLRFFFYYSETLKDVYELVVVVTQETVLTVSSVLLLKAKIKKTALSDQQIRHTVHTVLTVTRTHTIARGLSLVSLLIFSSHPFLEVCESP